MQIQTWGQPVRPMSRPVRPTTRGAVTFAASDKPKGQVKFKVIGMSILAGAMALLAIPIVKPPGTPTPIRQTLPAMILPTQVKDDTALALFQKTVTQPLIDTHGVAIELKSRTPILNNRGRVYAFENGPIRYELLRLKMTNGQITVVNMAPANSEQRGSWVLIESDQRKDLLYYAHNAQSQFADQMMAFVSGRGQLPQAAFSTQSPELTQAVSRDLHQINGMLLAITGEGEDLKDLPQTKAP